MVNNMKSPPQSRSLLSLSLRIRIPAQLEFKIPDSCLVSLYSGKHDYGFIKLKDSKFVIQAVACFRLLRSLFKSLLKFNFLKFKIVRHPTMSDEYNYSGL